MGGLERAPQTPQRSERPGEAGALLFSRTTVRGPSSWSSRLIREIEQERFGGVGGLDLQAALFFDGGAVALSEARAVDEQRAARDLEPRPASRRQRMLDALAPRQGRQVDGGVLVDRD